MEIVEVALKNFKIHSDRCFQFMPGTNVICGENGAGKTSIIEAIAWVLFDFDSSYNLSQLIKSGCSSAEAKVTFISSEDGCTYQVVRSTTKTGSSYKVFQKEPQLQNLGKEKKEDVLLWLKKHLGVASTTDLPDLFVNTIGIPQGTFTLDFALNRPEDRKKVFDPILKVEDYKQAFSDSAKLETHAEAQVKELAQKITYYNDRLSDWAALKQQRAECYQEIQRDEAQLQQLAQKLLDLQTALDQLNQLYRQLEQLAQQLERFDLQLQEKAGAKRQQLQAVERAKQAVAICTENHPGYLTYQQAEQALQGLAQARHTKETLERERARYEATRNHSRDELLRLEIQLQNFAAAQAEIEQLQPLLQQQEAGEQQLAALDQQLRELETGEAEGKKARKQLEKLQLEATQLRQTIERIQKLEPLVNQIPELEKQVRRYQEQLGRVGAAKQFETELHQLVLQGKTQGDRYLPQAQSSLLALQDIQQALPIYSAAIADAILALQSGMVLNEELLHALQQILTDLAVQVDEPQLRQQLKAAQTNLEKTYQQRLEFATLATQVETQIALEAEIQHMQSELSQLQVRLATKPTLVAQRSQIVEALTNLADPRGRLRLRQQQLQQEPQLRSQFNRLQQQQTEIEQQIQQLNLQLAPFEDLSDRTATQEALKKANEASYLNYIQHQNTAATLPTQEQALQEISEQLSQLNQQRLTKKAEYDELVQDYDSEQLEQLDTTYSQTERAKYQLDGALPGKRKELTRLDAELAQQEQFAQERDRAQRELQQKQRVYQFIKDARNVYKESGPQVTKLFTEKISQEADRIFRELLNRESAALQWQEDYEILVQEGGSWRGFKSLSGGEQMCAALAVRLALIRVLADIDIVFLDEPTTNMDEIRRKQLAQAVGNISNFRQLFVISHDDTFEAIADHVTLVERELVT